MTKQTERLGGVGKIYNGDELLCNTVDYGITFSHRPGSDNRGAIIVREGVGNLLDYGELTLELEDGRKAIILASESGNPTMPYTFTVHVNRIIE